MNNSAEEIVQIVDRDNRIAGECPRSVMRTQRLIHRACFVLVFNTRNELFVQKRTMIKDLYPGHWDIAAGGVVLAGESYETSAERELLEELGISGVSLEFRFDAYFEDPKNRVWGRIFTCIHDGPFHLQEDEIAYGRFMTVDEALDVSSSEPFTPDGLEVLKKIKPDLRQTKRATSLYLHGLDSSSRGTKGRYFTENFPDVITPDFTGSLQDRLLALETICKDLERLVIIASSFGGLMATCFTIAHPDRIQRLILLAPALNFPGYSAPSRPLDIPVFLLIGKNDTVTPPDIVIPAAKETFRNPKISLCDDDHLLRKTFFAQDWRKLLA